MTTRAAVSSIQGAPQTIGSLLEAQQLLLFGLKFLFGEDALIVQFGRLGQFSLVRNCGFRSNLGNRLAGVAVTVGWGVPFWARATWGVSNPAKSRQTKIQKPNMVFFITAHYEFRPIND